MLIEHGLSDYHGLVTLSLEHGLVTCDHNFH